MPRAYTKSHFIRAIAKANGLSRQKSTETVNILFEIIKRTLESGEKVKIRPKKLPFFKCGKELKERVDYK